MMTDSNTKTTLRERLKERLESAHSARNLDPVPSAPDAEQTPEDLNFITLEYEDDGRWYAPFSLDSGRVSGMGTGSTPAAAVICAAAMLEDITGAKHECPETAQEDCQHQCPYCQRDAISPAGSDGGAG